jgi:hypothetical protein
MTLSRLGLQAATVPTSALARGWVSERGADERSSRATTTATMITSGMSRIRMRISLKQLG